MERLTSEHFERGLTDSDWGVRIDFSVRTDYTPTSSQIERGLTDSCASVRHGFALRADFVPTPLQVKRGLKDEDWDVCEVFRKRQTEWMARWEAQELKRRHTKTMQESLKVSAL